MSDLEHIKDSGIHEGRMGVWSNLLHCDGINFDFFFQTERKLSRQCVNT